MILIFFEEVIYLLINSLYLDGLKILSYNFFIMHHFQYMLQCTATLHMCKSSQTISATEVLEPSSSLSISSFGIGVILAKGALASRMISRIAQDKNCLSIDRLAVCFVVRARVLVLVLSPLSFF